jgi:hypothetical protein
MMANKVPYVISEAHPDYKRPYLKQEFGIIEEDRIDTFFIEEVSEFILEREYINTINDIDDIKLFWRYYYDEYYMDNIPWEAKIFIHGKWKSVTLANEVIFQNIIAIKNGGKNRKSIVDNENEEFKFDKVFEWEQEFEYESGDQDDEQEETEEQDEERDNDNTF